MKLRLMPLSPRLLVYALVLGGPISSALAQQTLGELYATDASVKGSVILAGSGTSVLSGSAIQAGAQTATLKLERGGNLRVCPGTNLTITSSQSGRALLFSVNSGNLELDYPLGASADSLITPDFRLVLPGPGRLHAAVRIDPQGDTCVQTLSSNSTAITVYEAMGDDTYQVKDNEAVLFRAGHIKGVLPGHQNCGCPAPVAPLIQVAKSAPPPPPPSPNPEPKVDAKTETKPLAIIPSSNEHVAVDAPFIFHGDDPYPNLTANVAVLKIENNQAIQMDPVVLPPGKQSKADSAKPSQAAAKPEKRHGFLASVGSFFASIFR